MSIHTDITNARGILDPEGLLQNPLTNQPYSDNYKNLAKIWSSYPAYSVAPDILKSIATNQITFIISGTGSGKTVLIPKFALHYTDYAGKVAVTLPKRTVTISAAKFAAETLDVELGKEVGYLYKGSDRQMHNDNNKIVYMTDGIMTMKIIKDPLLTEYKIVVIDEAHERKVQIDLLLLFLKNILQSGKRNDLRVIIMSATIDGQKYKDYFKGISSNIINISGQPNYEIQSYYLPAPTKNYMNDGFDLISKIKEQGITDDMLFFITTSSEAFQLCNRIRQYFTTIYCIEVYADMDKNLEVYAKTKSKFLELGNYNQKLIMATNVAESSITIEGLKIVIDSGYELYSYFDPNTMANVLEKRLITKAQALQRKGRVGRTEPGTCYHLYTKSQYQLFDDFPTPDILRQDITIDLLKITQLTSSKLLKNGEQMLGELMDPPHPQYIDLAIDLYQLYNIVDKDNRLTSIANTITQFSSLSINRSLFLIYAYQLYCAKEASIILAMIDAVNGKISNLFYKGDTMCQSGCEKQSSVKLIRKLAQKQGDHFTLLAIYNEYESIENKSGWISKYGIRGELLKNAKNTMNTFYRKIVNLSMNQPERVVTIDTKKNIARALMQSHVHQTAIDMTTNYPKKKTTAKIARDSTLHYFYNKGTLASKKIIYDEFTNINGNFEFHIVSII